MPLDALRVVEQRQRMKSSTIHSAVALLGLWLALQRLGGPVAHRCGDAAVTRPVEDGFPQEEGAGTRVGLG
jgi:hypothetical protein